MALKFDATSKAMFRIDREAWLDLSETPPDGAVEDVNVDLSAISASADNIVKINNKKQPWAAIFEFASSHQKALLAKMAMRHHLVHLILEGLPVETILILMDKRAGQARFTGTYTISRKKQVPSSTFHYKVVRLWELSIEELLVGRPALMPLAVLSGEYKTRAEAADLLSRIFDGLNEKLGGDQDTILNLWASTEILLGLKFKGKVNKKWIQELTRGKLAVRESVIYQDILEEGREEGQTKGLQRAILTLCTKRFKKIKQNEQVALDAITDLDRLDRMIASAYSVSSWSELLQVP